MTPKPLNIAIFPQEIIWGDKKANLDTLINVAASLHPETDLLVLPEMFSTGFITSGSKEDVRVYAEKNSGATVETLKKIAATYRIAIAGSFMADTGGLLFNRAFFIEPNGEETFADKRHLFTMAGEHKIFSPGTDRLKIRYLGWNISMIVCYDIRFPVWCRNRENEYDLLLAVANWPIVRVGAWNALLTARAIENETYLAGVNCKGTDLNNFEYDGSSAIIDFKGKSIGTPDPTNGIIYARLDYEKLERFRTKFPAWQDADSFQLL